MRHDTSDFNESPDTIEEDVAPANVYFLSLVDPSDPTRDFGLVKVGFTGDVEKRIEQLQTGNPYQIYCEKSFASPVARQIEHWVHRTHAERGKQLEWLRLARHEIPGLVEAARLAGVRLAAIDEAKAGWSRSVSDGKERQPTADERRLHASARDIISQLCRVKLELRRARASIALRAGNVLHIEGIFRLKLILLPTKRFRPQLAFKNYADLAARYAVEEVRGKFRWREMPTEAAVESWKLRFEVESLEQQVEELDAAMLNSISKLDDEGQRTEELARLHDDFLILTQQEARLQLDAEEMKARLIQSMEASAAIRSVCSYPRSRQLVLDASAKKAFHSTHQREYEDCMRQPRGFVRRRIYKTRSY